MAAEVLGRQGWTLERSREGHRNYSVSFKVKAENSDGPATVTGAIGLPAVGATWTYGSDNDAWAFCTPYIKAEPILREEKNEIWLLTYKFTTEPTNRCNTNTIENPLLEPQKISGNFKSRNVKTTRDRNGDLIQTTAFEPVEVEFEEEEAEVTISQNVASLGLDTVTEMMNKVNSATMWGLAARKIKLSKFRWERKLYGVCNYYYTRTFGFDINFDTFDRSDIPNHSDKMIAGEWTYAPDPTFIAAQGASASNPRHFIKSVDYKGNPTKTFLNKTDGTPSASPTYLDTVEKYEQANLLLLGIPSTL